MSKYEFLQKCNEIESSTGFKFYEADRTSQICFFGTSDKFDAFKTLAVELDLPTGTVAYLMDTDDTKKWSKFKNTWY